MPQQRLTGIFLALALASLPACATNEIDRSLAGSDEAQDQTAAQTQNAAVTPTFNPYTSNLDTNGAEATAAGDTQSFILYGFHSVPCQAWTQARTNNSEDASRYEAWVTGFISGAGWRNAALAQTDYAAINYYLDGYCKRYPMNDLFMATRAMISKLKIRSR